MTEEELKAELEKLQKENEELREELEAYKLARDYKKIPVENKHVAVRQYSDGTYLVASPITKYTFRSDGFPEYELGNAIHKVRDKYITTALDWMIEECWPLELGGLKIVTDRNIQSDMIFMNYRLRRAFEIAYRNNQAEGFLRYIVDASR